MKRLSAIALAFAFLLTPSMTGVPSAFAEEHEADVVVEGHMLPADLEADLGQEEAEALTNGVEETLLEVSVEDVADILLEVSVDDDDDEMKEISDEIDAVIDNMEYEFSMLEKLDEDSIDGALANGRVDEFLQIRTFLEKNRRDIGSHHSRRLRNFRNRVRALSRKHKKIRQHFNRAKRRVMRNIRKFQKNFKLIRGQLDRLTPVERQFLEDEIKDDMRVAGHDLRERVQFSRSRDHKRGRTKYRQWCLENQDECRQHLELRREQRDARQQERHDHLLERCEKRDDAEACRNRLNEKWEKRMEKKEMRRDKVDEATKACANGKSDLCKFRLKEAKEALEERVDEAPAPAGAGRGRHRIR